MKQTLNEQFIRMQKLAGVITESQINENIPSSFPTQKAWELWLKLSEENEIEDYDLNNFNHLQVGSFLKELQWIENNKDKYSDEELSQEFSNYLDESDYDLDIEFKKAPNEAPYNDVLDIMKSYEDESVLNDFKAEFSEGEPVNKKDYSDFAMTLIDDMSEVSFIQANWINMFDEDVYDKAGLI